MGDDRGDGPQDVVQGRGARGRGARHRLGGRGRRGGCQHPGRRRRRAERAAAAGARLAGRGPGPARRLRRHPQRLRRRLGRGPAVARRPGPPRPYRAAPRDHRLRRRQPRPAARCLRRSAGAPTLAAQPGERTAYRRLADYEADLRRLAADNPGVARLVELPHQSLEGRTVLGIEIAEDVAAKDGRPTFYMDGVHHAREWPASEFTIMWAFDLLESYRAGRRAGRRPDAAAPLLHRPDHERRRLPPQPRVAGRQLRHRRRATARSPTGARTGAP